MYANTHNSLKVVALRVTNNLSYFYEAHLLLYLGFRRQKLLQLWTVLWGFFVSSRSELPVVFAFEKIWTSWILWNVMTYADYEVKGFINKTLPWSNCFLVGIASNRKSFLLWSKTDSWHRKSVIKISFFLKKKGNWTLIINLHPEASAFLKTESNFSPLSLY